MAAFIRSGGSWVPRVNAYVKDGDTWKTINSAFVKDGGTWKEIWSPGGGGFSASAFPTLEDVFGTTSDIFSSPFSVTVTGGASPYTYQWSQVSGDVTIQILGSTSDAPVFRVTGMGIGEVRSGVFECLVTDSATNQTTSNQISVGFTRES